MSNEFYKFDKTKQMVSNPDLLTKEEVIKLVSPYAEQVYTKIFEGFSDYLKHDSDVKHIHDKTTKANIIRSRVINRIKELIALYPEWTWVAKRQSIYLTIGGSIKLRFKKLGRTGKTENMQTDAILDFRGQVKTSDHSAAKYINIDIAYKLNEFLTEIENIFIVAPDNKKNLWKVIFKPEGVAIGQSIPLHVDSEEDRNNQIKIAQVKPNLRRRNDNDNKAAGQ